MKAIMMVSSGSEDQDGNWVMCVENPVPRVLHVDAVTPGRDSSRLWVDSGCFDHCCPVDFATQFPLRKEESLTANTASNTPLQHFGRRTVHGWFEDLNEKWIPVTIKFHEFRTRSHCSRRVNYDLQDTQQC